MLEDLLVKEWTLTEVDFYHLFLTPQLVPALEVISWLDVVSSWQLHSYKIIKERTMELMFKVNKDKIKHVVKEIKNHKSTNYITNKTSQTNAFTSSNHSNKPWAMTVILSKQTG